MDQTIEFVGGMFGTRTVEITAATLGFINVYLIIRRTIWNYPFGILMVILYAWIFWDYKLYAESGLQIYFLVIQCFGWWWWIKGRGGDGLIIVERSSLQELTLCAACAIFVALGLGFVLSSFTDSSLPYWDSAVAALSVIAQYLLARRRLESWPVWIAVDIIAIGIYLSKGLYPTAVLYGLFLCMATAGLFLWFKAFKNKVAVPA